MLVECPHDRLADCGQGRPRKRLPPLVALAGSGRDSLNIHQGDSTCAAHGIRWQPALQQSLQGAFSSTSSSCGEAGTDLP
jgi:hypothetical protein